MKFLKYYWKHSQNVLVFSIALSLFIAFLIGGREAWAWNLITLFVNLVNIAMDYKEFKKGA
jgi:hypothetical protein